MSVTSRPLTTSRPMVVRSRLVDSLVDPALFSGTSTTGARSGTGPSAAYDTKPPAKRRSSGVAVFRRALKQ